MATGGKFGRSQIDASDAIYDFSCNPCAKDGKNTEALFKCVDCQTLYCQSCVTGHNKFTNNHNVVDKSSKLFGQDQVKHARSMSSSELPVDLCQEHHGEVIKMYCGQHDLVCCNVCIALKHRGCEGVEYIPNVAKGLDNVQIKLSFSNIKDGLKNLMSEMQKELKALDKDRDGILDEIQKFKKRLIERIEELEKKSMNEVIDKHKEIATDINERSKKIDDMLKDIDMRLNKLEDSNTTNEAQTFVDIKHGERAVADGNDVIQQVHTKQDKAMQFEIDRDIENFLRGITCLGHLTLQNEAMTFHPRQCHVIKWPDFSGYGFEIGGWEEKDGHFIDDIEYNSPAQDAGLWFSDRIIELNNENIENETYEQAIARIKAGGNEIKLLVVDREADAYYESRGITVTSSLPEVKFLQTTRRRQSAMTFHPRQCHVIKRPDFSGYGFEICEWEGKYGHFIDDIEDNSPAQDAGLCFSDRIIEVNNENIENETYEEVIAIIKAGGSEIKLLVVDREADAYYKSRGITVTSSMPEVKFLQTTRRKQAAMTFHPRQCHVIKWPDFSGYGFDICEWEEKDGQFIELKANSPAQDAGLCSDDRIIEVNNENIENETYQQVIARIKAGGNGIKLLVVDREADAYYESRGITVTSSMPEVKFLQTTRRKQDEQFSC